jgi:hypothetical protein
MGPIRRTVALTAASAMAALVTAAASACGGAPTASGTTTKGLEKKSSADMLQAAAAALRAAKSVYITSSAGSGLLGASLRIHGESLRIQGDSQTFTLTLTGGSAEITRIGGDTYLKADRGGLKMLGAPRSVQRHLAGRWLDVPPADFSFKGALHGRLHRGTADKVSQPP